MELFYERNMVDVKNLTKTGIVKYDYSSDESRYQDRIGANPLRITARQIYGFNLTDPVISHADALKILSLPENRKLLEDGRIVILLDTDKLVHGVAAPDKNREYYARYERLKTLVVENGIPAIVMGDPPRGIQMSVQDLRFEADTAVLIPQERPRLDSIADSLRGFIGSGYLIAIEGHAASTGNPDGEMTVSIARAEAIYNELRARGFPDELISYRGFGSTQPITENDTADGRALNRRVEIIIMPNTTYVQRSGEP